jgi:MSHA biogenesis protein MshJ
MKELMGKMAARYNGLNPRERIMVFLAGVVVVGGLMFAGFIDGAQTQRKVLTGGIAANQAELAQLQARNADLQRMLIQDPDQAARQRAEALKQELAAYDTQLRGMQQGLVAPERMVRLLEGMLATTPRVRVVRLHTLPVSPLIEPEKAADGQAAPAPETRPVFKHGIELTVEGSYLDLLDYQSRLEKLPWRVFFAHTSVDSSRYPKVRMTVTLYTLSLEETWLVV